ncbi:MAG: sulfurtransferase TusA family protein [Sphaerochaetaceae bacterium]|jgi:tRNA 2-thiouridine synthesizing protein A|nr:sulfurtransferase TusA family protein [Sphaerochaetaceae bacterium]
MIIVDAKGLSCPQPVIETKKALASRPEEAAVIVDNIAARENVSRYANAMGYDIDVSFDNGQTRILLKRR